jgi:hypothetical protein
MTPAPFTARLVRLLRQQGQSFAYRTLRRFVSERWEHIEENPVSVRPTA